MRTVLSKVGNSYAMIFPKLMLAILDVDPGKDALQVTFTGAVMTVRKLASTRLPKKGWSVPGITLTFIRDSGEEQRLEVHCSTLDYGRRGSGDNPPEHPVVEIVSVSKLKEGAPRGAPKSHVLHSFSETEIVRLEDAVLEAAKDADASAQADQEDV